MSETLKIIIEAVDKFSSTFNAVESKISDVKKKINKNLLSIGAAITSAGVGGAWALTNLASKAASAQDVMENFNRVLGDKSVSVLSEMQKETKGTVSKFELMSLATQGVVRGFSSDLIPLLSDYIMRAKDAGIVTGTFGEAFSSVTAGAASNVFRGAKQMGLFKDLDDETQIYEKWAEKHKAIGESVVETYYDTDEDRRKLISDMSRLNISGIGDKLTELQTKGMVKLDLGVDMEQAVATMTEAEKQMAIQEAMQQSLIDANEKLAKSNKDISDSLDAIKVKFDEISTEIGTKLLPALTPIAQKLLDILDAWNNLSPGTQQLIANFALIATVSALVIGPIIAIAGAVSILGSAAAFLGISLGALLLWIGGIILAIGLLIAIWYRWDEIVNFFKKNFGSFVKYLVYSGTVFDWVFANMMLFFGKFSNWITAEIEEVINSFVSFINVLIDAYNFAARFLGLPTLKHLENLNLSFNIDTKSLEKNVETARDKMDNAANDLQNSLKDTLQAGKEIFTGAPKTTTADNVGMSMAPQYGMSQREDTVINIAQMNNYGVDDKQISNSIKDSLQGCIPV